MLLGHEHLAKSPFAECFDERVGTDLLPWTVGDFGLGSRAEALSGSFEKAVIGLVNKQEGLEPGLEGGIAFAAPAM